MRYSYVAYNTNQGIAKGEVRAENEFEAELAVKKRGYKLLDLRRPRRFGALDELFPSLFRVSTGELVTFARQLATLVSTGTSLVRSLELMQEQTKNRVLRRSLASILTALENGESFSVAVSQHPRVFGILFCRVVEVGEYTGKLDTGLRQIADLLERENQAKKKAMKSMAYPLAVVGMALASTAILFTTALPPLLDVFKQMGSALPLPTRMAVYAVQQTKGRIPLLLGIIVALVLLSRLLLRIERVRYLKDKLTLRVPVVGTLMMSWELSRFCRSAAMLLEAGVVIPVVIDLLMGSCNNLLVRRAFADAGDSVMRGESLAAGLGRLRVMPPLFMQMVMTGEETNSLRQTMNDAADNYQQQVDDRLGALVGILEPVATLGVALLVGFIAYSMFVPIYSGLGALNK